MAKFCKTVFTCMQSSIIQSCEIMKILAIFVLLTTVTGSYSFSLGSLTSRKLFEPLSAAASVISSVPSTVSSKKNEGLGIASGLINAITGQEEDPEVNKEVTTHVNEAVKASSLENGASASISTTSATKNKVSEPETKKEPNSESNEIVDLSSVVSKSVNGLATVAKASLFTVPKILSSLISGGKSQEVQNDVSEQKDNSNLPLLTKKETTIDNMPTNPAPESIIAKNITSEEKKPASITSALRNLTDLISVPKVTNELISKSQDNTIPSSSSHDDNIEPDASKLVKNMSSDEPKEIKEVVSEPKEKKTSELITKDLAMLPLISKTPIESSSKEKSEPDLQTIPQVSKELDSKLQDNITPSSILKDINIKPDVSKLAKTITAGEPKDTRKTDSEVKDKKNSASLPQDLTMLSGITKVPSEQKSQIDINTVPKTASKLVSKLQDNINPSSILKDVKKAAYVSKLEKDVISDEPKEIKDTPSELKENKHQTSDPHDLTIFSGIPKVPIEQKNLIDLKTGPTVTKKLATKLQDNNVPSSILKDTNTEPDLSKLGKDVNSGETKDINDMVSEFKKKKNSASVPQDLTILKSVPKIHTDTSSEQKSQTGLNSIPKADELISNLKNNLSSIAIPKSNTSLPDTFRLPTDEALVPKGTSNSLVSDLKQKINSTSVPKDFTIVPSIPSIPIELSSKQKQITDLISVPINTSKLISKLDRNESSSSIIKDLSTVPDITKLPLDLSSVSKKINDSIPVPSNPISELKEKLNSITLQEEVTTIPGVLKVPLDLPVISKNLTDLISGSKVENNLSTDVTSTLLPDVSIKTSEESKKSSDISTALKSVTSLTSTPKGLTFLPEIIKELTTESTLPTTLSSVPKLLPNITPKLKESMDLDSTSKNPSGLKSVAKGLLSLIISSVLNDSVEELETSTDATSTLKTHTDLETKATTPSVSKTDLESETKKSTDLETVPKVATILASVLKELSDLASTPREPTSLKTSKVDTNLESATIDSTESNSKSKELKDLKSKIMDSTTTVADVDSTIQNPTNLGSVLKGLTNLASTLKLPTDIIDTDEKEATNSETEKNTSVPTKSSNLASDIKEALNGKSVHNEPTLNKGSLPNILKALKSESSDSAELDLVSKASTGFKSAKKELNELVPVVDASKKKVNTESKKPHAIIIEAILHSFIDGLRNIFLKAFSL